MILGHKKQIQFLKNIFNSGRMPHALLFTGPEKIGKKKVAFELASWILKENPKKHPDFALIEPKEKIQISQIREFLTKFSLKPIKSDRMVGIIDDAHLMTEEAQQCFLKTLEEPKAPTLFILITAFPNLLLPTILSRCQKISFLRLRNEEIIQFLDREKNLEEKEKQMIIEIAAGRPGVMLNFLSEEKRKKILRELAMFPKFSLAQRFQIAKEIGESENIKEILKDWLDFFHYLFLKKIRQPQNSKAIYSLEKVKLILEELQKTFLLISTTNVNPRSALEILMLHF